MSETKSEMTKSEEKQCRDRFIAHTLYSIARAMSDMHALVLSETDPGEQQELYTDLMEIERNLQGLITVARGRTLKPKAVPKPEPAYES